MQRQRVQAEEHDAGAEPGPPSTERDAGEALNQRLEDDAALVARQGFARSRVDAASDI